MVYSQTNQQPYPRNTGELFKYILKKIPERLLKALPLTIAIGIGSWLLHTYLLVYVNEGFNPDTWLGRNILNVKGSFWSSTLLWTMVGAIVPIIISFFRKGGNPVNAITSIAKLPVDIINKSKTDTGYFLPIIVFACAGTLIVDKVLSGVTSIIAGGIIMSSVVSLITGRGSIFIQIIRMISNDIMVYVLKKKSLKLDNEKVMIIIGTSGTVFLLFGLLKTFFFSWFITILARIPVAGFIFSLMISYFISYLWLILLILGFVLYYKKKNAPKTFMFFIGFIGMAFLFKEFFNGTVLADDGGWQEAGGTFGSWIRSSGAVTATLSGFPPAIGGLVGTYVSSILSNIFSGFTGFDPFSTTMQNDIPSTPTTQVDKPLTDEQIKQQQKEKEEQERLRLEFERKRQLEIQKHEQERQKALKELERIRKERAERQKYIDYLCNKYNTTPDNLRSVIKKNMGENAAEAQSWMDYDKKLAYAETAAKLTVVACDTAVDGLANCTGVYGKAVRAGYKVTKSIASNVAEDGFSKESVLSGAVTGGADAATDFIDNPYAKAAVTIAGETAGGAVKDGWEGAKDGLIKGTFNAGVNAGMDKIAGKGYGDNVIGGPGKKTWGTELSDFPANLKGNGTPLTSWRYTQNGSASKDVTNLVAGKLVRQGQQSLIKGTGQTINDIVVKPALGLD